MHGIYFIFAIIFSKFDALYITNFVYSKFKKMYSLIKIFRIMLLLVFIENFCLFFAVVDSWDLRSNF